MFSVFERARWLASTSRMQPFDNLDWILALKIDHFRTAADTVRGRLISRDWMQRFAGVLDRLPKVTCSTASWSCWTKAGVLCSTSFCLAVVIRRTWPSSFWVLTYEHR
jgi:hypothetical protein